MALQRHQKEDKGKYLEINIAWSMRHLRDMEAKPLIVKKIKMAKHL